MHIFPANLCIVNVDESICLIKCVYKGQKVLTVVEHLAEGTGKTSHLVLFWKRLNWDRSVISGEQKETVVRDSW